MRRAYAKIFIYNSSVKDTTTAKSTKLPKDLDSSEDFAQNRE
jgi:hypothetical protein